MTLDNPKKDRRRGFWGVILMIFLCILLVIGIVIAGTLFRFARRLGTAVDDPKENNKSIEEIIREEFGITDGPIENLSELFSELFNDNKDPDVSEAIRNADNNLNENERTEPIPVTSGIKNYLIIGTDTRTTSSNGRSDSMILFTINSDTNKIHLTSLMRAMYVTLPLKSGNINGMLNWSYSYGGAELAVRTVELNFKVDIDGYAVINFDAFQKVIDAVGGVKIDLTQTEVNYLNQSCKTNLSVGPNTLTGKVALEYARMRHTDNDFKRTGRQRNVVTSVLSGLKTLDGTELASLSDELIPHIKTDLSAGDIVSLLSHSTEFLSYSIDQHMLPIENEAGNTYTGITFINGREMYIVDWKNNLKVLADFINS